MEGFIGMKMFFSTLNVILIGALLWSYTNVYREIPTRFTMSLIIFSIALLLYALMSNPLVHTVLGFRGSGLGPFAFIPDLFATVAVIVLLTRVTSEVTGPASFVSDAFLLFYSMFAYLAV